MAYNGGDIAFAPYGDYWKHMRKICTSELLNTKRIHSNYPLMEEEISRLVKNIKESSSKGTLINVYECLNSLSCAIICRATVGTTCNDSDSLISDLFPSLKFLDRYITGSNQKLLKMHHELCDRILEEIVHVHEESIRKNNVDEEDRLHLLLRIREKVSHKFQIPITRDNIKAIILECYLLRQVVNLYWLRLLYHFDWKLPNGMNPEDLDMIEGFGAAATRKNNLYLVATPYD
ncbi:hypothetical protein MTR67_033830 [Solanum verrucosum]|uniref:Cytochrome P450 n=1 Tax=Solanum verrucosum TaxID=315347 RepID=A0AAF0ZJP5_SOLVR|nr:hypothetical protein MTR67_033830 [Solanum verrucosum]